MSSPSSLLLALTKIAHVVLGPLGTRAHFHVTNGAGICRHYISAFVSCVLCLFSLLPFALLWCNLGRGREKRRERGWGGTLRSLQNKLKYDKEGSACDWFRLWQCLCWQIRDFTDLDDRLEGFEAPLAMMKSRQEGEGKRKGGRISNDFGNEYVIL